MNDNNLNPQRPDQSKIDKNAPLDSPSSVGNQKKSPENNAQNKQKESEESLRQTSGRTCRTESCKIFSLAASHKEQTIIYLLLAAGLLILFFFNNLLGGLIIGGVTGFYFASEIICYLRNLGQIVRGNDQLRYVILTALLLGLFIEAPGIFIGALIVALFKQVFTDSDDDAR